MSLVASVLNHPLLVLIFCAAIWGASASLYKIGSFYATGLELAFLRLFVGGLCLVMICVMQKKLVLKKKDIFNFLFIGLFNFAIPFLLIAKASSFMDTGIITILNGFYPIFVAILSSLVLKQKMSRQSMFGVFLALCGFFMIYVNVFLKNSQININTIGVLMVVCANICYAIAVIFNKARCKDIDPIISSAFSISFGAICLMPFFASSFNFSNLLIPKFVLVILTIGIFGTAIAYYLYFLIIKKYGTSIASMESFLIPIFGSFYGFLFFHEKITIFKIIGGLLILAGMKFLINFSFIKAIKDISKKV